MKAKTIITKLLPVLTVAAMLLLSSCAARMTKQKMLTWIDSQPLSEEFPYPPNIYQLDKPTAQEEGGITIAPTFLGQNCEYKGLLTKNTHHTANTNSFLVPAVKTTINESRQIDISIQNSNDSPDFKNLLYSDTYGMDFSPLSLKGKDVTKSNVKFNNSEILCKNVSIIGTQSQDGPMFHLDLNSVSSNHIGFKDIDNDRIITLGEPYMIAYPDKKIKIGEQWEKQVYSEIPCTITYGVDRKLERTNYQIYLYTYTLTGFANVQGVRCAIISYSADLYAFFENGAVKKNKEDIKNTVKTLSKQSVKSIQEYMNKSGYAIAGQGSMKIEGVIACDYKTGLVVDSHYGGYTLSGHGVAESMSVEGVEKIQSVFKLTK